MATQSVETAQDRARADAAQAVVNAANCELEALLETLLLLADNGSELNGLAIKGVTLRASQLNQIIGPYLFEGEVGNVEEAEDIVFGRDEARRMRAAREQEVAHG